MKNILFIAAFIILLNGFAQAQNCLETSRKYFDKKDYISAEHALEKCSPAESKNANIQISMGSIKLQLGKYDEANKYFENALKTMPKKSRYRTYVYSSLGDIAMQKNQINKAMAYYKNALKYQPADVNSLVGYGLTLEKTGKKALAAKQYKKALDVDFANLPARANLIRLEPDCLTEQEQMIALKDRNIIDFEATNFTKEDFDMLKKILRAERGSAIEYLSLKFGPALPEGSVFERNPGTFYARKMLTLSGYNLLIENLSAEAKEFFLSKKISSADLFRLKDFNSNPVFDKNGLLTEEGLMVYNRGLKGKKAYLLPGERAPVQQEKIDKILKEYREKGYEEVSPREFEYVEEETQCPEEVLISKLGCRTVGDGKDKRYFVLNAPGTVPPFSVPYETVMRYRDERKEHGEDNPPVYRRTFGEEQNLLPPMCDENGNYLGL